MSSNVRIFETHGSRFGVAISGPDEVTATAPAEKLSLPDDVMSILSRTELQPRTPAGKQEWNALVSDRYNLNERTKAYVERTYAEWRADLERRHEAAKAGVVEQGAVLEKFKRTLVEDSQEFLRADNARRVAESAAHGAEMDLKNLSRFASKAELADAEKRVELATKKMEAAEGKAAEWGEHLNQMKLVVIPAENKKLEELIAREMELSCALSGRDPFLARYGFQQR